MKKMSVFREKKYQNAFKWLQRDLREVQSVDSVYNAHVTW